MNLNNNQEKNNIYSKDVNKNIDLNNLIKTTRDEFVLPKGFKTAGITCGIKQSGKKDLAIIVSDKPASAAAVFTTNKMAAAPVLLSKNHVENGKIQAVIVNSGNANACTGIQGMNDAITMANITAEKIGISPADVLVASTGIIGVNLPMALIEPGIEKACEKLSENSGNDAAEAIMTTDTFPKIFCVLVDFNGKTVTISGISKGSGMIEPNMATMLSFIVTDAEIESSLLQSMLKKSVDISFNSITVDGDTSTNDMVAILANGESGVKISSDSYISIDEENAIKSSELFQKALDLVCIEHAKLIVRDGEGATKLIEIEVVGAQNYEDAKKAAKAIANSNLVKTAFFGGDPNWGRVVCAVGYSSANIDANKIDVFYGDEKLVENGQPLVFDRKKVELYLKQNEVRILVDLKVGDSSAKVWTCDLSYDYVKINAEYHT